jgi:hypothetical protein
LVGIGESDYPGGAFALVRNRLGERGSTPVVPVNVLTEVHSPVALHPGGLIIE